MESGGGVRVPIPLNLNKMIQDIKEITGNHSDDEILAMLRECDMDPNDATQRLLFQDTFHEVKRKRGKKKEVMQHISQEAGDSRWRPGPPGGGNRGGRANFSARRTSHEADGGRTSGPGRQNASNQGGKKGFVSLPASNYKSKNTSSVSQSSAVMANGPSPSSVTLTSAIAMHASHSPAAGSASNQQEITLPPNTDTQLEKAVSPTDADKSPTVAFGTGDTHVKPIPSSNSSPQSVTPASSSTVCFSSLDPVLVPSNDSRLPGTVSTIKREVGSQRTAIEPSLGIVPTEKSASEIGTSVIQVNMPSRVQVVGNSQIDEPSQASLASVHVSSSGSRPSSSYSNRLRQMSGPPKAGSNMEWKPKPTNPNVTQGCGATITADNPSVPVQASVHPRPASGVLDSEEAASKLQKKLEDMHLSWRPHVIIPNHIQVPESERTKLSFGSFDVEFGYRTIYASAANNEEIPTQSETSEGIDDSLHEHTKNNKTTSATGEVGAYPNHPESPSHVPENLSGESEVVPIEAPQYNESKQETTIPGGEYNLGFTSQIASQVAPFENSESQARDVSHVPNFVVQQPFDLASYYAQFYRSGADSDGHISPFPLPGIGAKYNGNAAAMPSHTSQTQQEGANPLVLSTAGPNPLVTQPAGLMQSSIAVTQQPVPVFRPPAGLHISHYPPNYIPYGHYISPFYVSPPGMHQLLNNGAFPQQPQAGGMYPAPPVAAAAGVKFPVPQYKPGSNTGNATQVGIPSGYGPYGSSPAGHYPSSASAGGNSTANEDLGTNQFRESNVYIPGQQNDGSAVWVATPGRDISSLPTTSFYNLPPQGQHITFAPTQSGHGTFTGVYHPAQAITASTVHPLLQQSQPMAGGVDIGGPAASVYQQQQQHEQVNWPSNY